MGHAKKRGTYEERVVQSKKGIKTYEQFLESKEKDELPKVEKENQ
tara:strand:- start:57 stop:191 length:135 start_codon:yes stop_codon:yes gene_type:complete